MSVNAADDRSTLREARDRYLAENGLGDGGYDARWVKLQAGPLPIFVPNTQARVRAVRFHDLHHPLTGYTTTWTGEAEIGAWEIASSCADHFTAWLLNLAAVAIGVLIAPRATFAAFVRGRSSQNLYRERFDDALLAEPLADARRRLGLDREPPPATTQDRIAFAGWTALSLAFLAATVALPLLAIAALVRALAGLA